MCLFQVSAELNNIFSIFSSVSLQIYLKKRNYIHMEKANQYNQLHHNPTTVPSVSPNTSVVLP